jgi:hypothetical protein
VSEAPERGTDDPVGGSRLGDVSFDGDDTRILGGLDRAGAGHDRPAALAVSGHQARADTL